MTCLKLVLGLPFIPLFPLSPHLQALSPQPHLWDAFPTLPRQSKNRVDRTGSRGTPTGRAGGSGNAMETTLSGNRFSSRARLPGCGRTVSFFSFFISIQSGWEGGGPGRETP